MSQHPVVPGFVQYKCHCIMYTVEILLTVPALAIESVASQECKDKRTNWCSELSVKHPETFSRLCEPNWSDRLGCCKTCEDTVPALAIESVASPKCKDRRADWCSELSLKHPETFARLCEPKWW